MKGFDFYIEQLTDELNSYELKMFRVQHDETQLVAWFGLKAATLPYNDIGDTFLIPAIELTHFAVDERFRNPMSDSSIKTGEYIFWNYILPIVQDVSQKVASKALFVFAIDTPKLVKYYKNVLKFKEITNTNEKQFFEYAAPDYDEGCKFMYYPLTE